MRIELGGGMLCEDGWVNLDPVHGEGEWKRRAQDVPWPAEGVEMVRASHVLEHVPAGKERISVFNEAHRVLLPGGTFRVIVPLAPDWRAFADPTHVSFFVAESFGYFDGTICANADYGIRRWETLDFHVEGGWEGHWLGQKW